jgi:hypothetical protein
VALTFMAVVLAACLVAATLLLSQALNERQAIRDRALSTAVALSFGFDQEVAAVNYLLRGLATSPALLSGDIKGFYDQLKATHVPEGSGLALQDLEGQVINTFRPYGDPTLPKHTAFPNYQEQIARIRDRRWSVSGRQFGVVIGAVVIALSLRIDGPDGEMKYFLTTVLSGARLNMILDDTNVPADWTKALYDRSYQPIVTVRGGQRTPEIPAPAALRARLADAGPNSATDGLVEGVDERGPTGRPPSPCPSPSSTRRSRASCGRWPCRRRFSCSLAASLPCSRPVRSNAPCGRSRIWSPRRRARSRNCRRNCSPCRRRSASASPASCTTPPPSASWRLVLD